MFSGVATQRILQWLSSVFVCLRNKRRRLGLRVAAAARRAGRLNTADFCARQPIFSARNARTAFIGMRSCRSVSRCADGDRLILQGLRIDRQTERRAGFVHAGVAFADVLFDVELHVPGFAQVVM